MKKQVRHGAVWLVWIVIWQLAAALIQNKIIFVGPWEAALALISQLPTAELWRTILSSFVRIAGGFLGAFAVGILMAALAGRFRLLRELLEPPTAVLQSVPVASFVILALIWIGSENLSVLITFLVVFPVIYRNMLEGIGQVDRKMLEMGQVFRMSAWRKLCYIYRPAVMPYLLAGCRVSLGMAWKSGIAAEVIGVPSHSIGEKLYMAKIYLSTAELFAWTFVIVVVSRAFEWMFLQVMELLMWDIRGKCDGRGAGHTGSDACDPGKATGDDARDPGKMAGNDARDPGKATGNDARDPGKSTGDDASDPEKMAGNDARDPGKAAGDQIALESICKSYHGRTVLKNVSIQLEPGRIYCLMGPSGQGKTTLLRIMMGLETADSGRITGLERRKISAVFQEDRLCSFLDGIKNIQIASGKKVTDQMAERLLGQLLEKEALHQPVRELSGGMRRRAAIARALAAESELLLMDEPFTGLDEETRKRTIAVIKKNLRGRTLLLVTHQEEDAELLGAELIRLNTV